MFLVVLYGSRIANDIYQPYKGLSLNIILVVLANIACYFITISLYKNYYIQKTDNPIYLDDTSMEKYANQGEKQFRIEFFSVGGMGIIIALVGHILFFKFSNIELLVVGCLGSALVISIFLMKPFARLKALRAFQSREIKLNEKNTI